MNDKERPALDTRPEQPVARAEQVAWLVIALFVVLSRWLASPDILVEWDSANYVHGWLDFNVYEHAPHAPGYPLFVLALRVLTVLPGSMTTPFLILNTAFTLGILAMLGHIARAETSGTAHGRAVALAVVAAFAVCPLLWYHGSISTAYVAECFSSTLVGYAAWRVARRRMGVVLAAVLLAVAGGIRPTTLVYLSPLLAVALVESRRKLPEWGLFAGTAAAGVALWLTPTILLSGGWTRYKTTHDALVEWQSGTHSVLSGSWGKAWDNVGNLALYVGDALNLLIVLLAACAVVLLVKRHFRPFWPSFLVAWCLPAALLYMLHHLPKAGYALTILPGLFLGCGLAFSAAADALGPRGRRALWAFSGVWLALTLLVNTAAFVLAIPGEALDDEEAEIPIAFPVVITGDYGWQGIRWRTEPQRRVRDLVEEYGGEGTAMLFLWRTHQLQRIDSVYHPGQWSLTSALDHGCIHNNLDDSEQYCGTFGDFQVRILQPPAAGMTWRRATHIELDDGRLTLRRQGKRVSVDLEPVPSRLLVVTSCPPCQVELGAGLQLMDELRIDAKHRMMIAGVNP